MEVKEEVKTELAVKEELKVKAFSSAWFLQRTVCPFLVKVKAVFFVSGRSERRDQGRAFVRRGGRIFLSYTVKCLSKSACVRGA